MNPEGATELPEVEPLTDEAKLSGELEILVLGPDGEVKHRQTVKNLVTQVGDQAYAERGAGIGSIAAPTGMQLGTGTTAVAKTGAGAGIVTLVAASLVATSTPTSALNGSARRITYVTTWSPGVATSNVIAEVALVNQSTGTQTVAPASATYARALLAPAVDKLAGDTIVVTWNHDLLGA